MFPDAIKCFLDILLTKQFLSYCENFLFQVKESLQQEKNVLPLHQESIFWQENIFFGRSDTSFSFEDRVIHHFSLPHWLLVFICIIN